eukprot:TRINITY_DN3886_c0_g1_i2.p1 TRINITY_DN3886_c0_g1~~TRINITY_DN3886_c0_g1_i2.p1  ORF type:complete len:159 (+),score=68.51 TRINITY_DN3886_c0_g1_i2:61-477(+)
MVEVSVPMVGLSEEEGRVAASSVVVKKERPDRAKLMTEFFQKHGIAAMVSRLIGILMRDKPKDPVAHIVQHLLSPEKGVPPCEDVTPFMDDESRQYLLKHKIHFLFDEFLNHLVDNNPPDIVQFCLTWMRWNKKRFTV